MSLLWIIMPIVQVLLAIHAYKRGNTAWMLIVLFLPGVGAIFYFFVEYLPSLRHDTVVKPVSNSISRQLMPDRELQKLKDEVAFNNCVKNRLALANGYLQNGQATEAVSLFENCLEGVYKNDPAIILSVAKAYFDLKKYDDALDKLNYLREQHHGYKPVEVTQLFGMIHEETGAVEKALQEYESIIKLGVGEEIRCRYAQALQKLGKVPDAMIQFETIISNARVSPGYYKSSEKRWIEIANNEIRLYQKSAAANT